MLAQRLAERSGIEVVQSVAPGLPHLAPDVVVYRVAQEALTNVARHSGSDLAQLALQTGDGHLLLTVTDHGRGLTPGHPPGTGLRGMRERATLVGATLQVANNPSGTGCTVRLDVPLKDAS